MNGWFLWDECGYNIPDPGMVWVGEQRQNIFNCFLEGTYEGRSKFAFMTVVLKWSYQMLDCTEPYKTIGASQKNDTETPNFIIDAVAVSLAQVCKVGCVLTCILLLGKCTTSVYYFYYYYYYCCCCYYYYYYCCCCCYYYYYYCYLYYYYSYCYCYCYCYCYYCYCYCFYCHFYSYNGLKKKPSRWWFSMLFPLAKRYPKTYQHDTRKLIQRSRARSSAEKGFKWAFL